MNFIKIKSIKKLSNLEMVYDIETEDDHSFFGNGVCLHNSFSPNLQNFPKRGEEGKEFRKVFIAPEDYYFCEADYSGFQLRLMGIYSDDKVMIDAFVNKSGDLHSVTGKEFFCRDADIDTFIKNKKKEPYKTARNNGKEMNLAFSFGYTSFSFQNKLKDTWTEKQINDYIVENKLTIIKELRTNTENKLLTVATDLYNKFFIKYPDLKNYIKKAQDIAKSQGYIDCPIFPGLRRHLPELLKIGSNLSKEKLSHYSNLLNIAPNAGAQGGEAFIIYRALTKIHNEIKRLHLKSKLVGMVHDSICLYIEKSEVLIMCKLLKECMEVFDYTIPILAEIEMGYIWGFAPEISDKLIENNTNEDIINYIEANK